MLDRIAYTANRLKYISWLPLLVYKAKHNYKAVLVFETYVPNKLQIFVGHGNVKDHLSVKKIGLWVAVVLTNQLKLNSHLCHVVKIQLSPSI